MFSVRNFIEQAKDLKFYKAWKQYFG
jgi:hypothetical protein